MEPAASPAAPETATTVTRLTQRGLPPVPAAYLSADCISVTVRVRPINLLELAEESGACLQLAPDDQNTLNVLASSGKTGMGGKVSASYKLHAVLEPGCTQAEAYTRTAKPIVDAVLHGINGTVLCYGQTGSGKTYTAFGAQATTCEDEPADSRGLIPRSVADLFVGLGSLPTDVISTVNISIVELYNERLQDLLVLVKPAKPGQAPSRGARRGSPSVATLSSPTVDARRGGSSHSLRAQTSAPAPLTEADTGLSLDLSLVRDDLLGMQVCGATTLQVQTASEVDTVLRMGTINRARAATRMNEDSSRSHVIVTMTVVQQSPYGVREESAAVNSSGSVGKLDGAGVLPTGESGDVAIAPGPGGVRADGNGGAPLTSPAAPATAAVAAAASTATGAGAAASTSAAVPVVRCSKLVFVDLAGSERPAKSRVAGAQLQEAQAINSSLSTLGLVVNALANGAAHIPYRDSKLTRLLQDAIAASARTALVVTVSPSAYSLEETKSSLRFGAAAARVRVAAKPNVLSPQASARREALERLQRGRSYASFLRDAQRAEAQAAVRVREKARLAALAAQKMASLGLASAAAALAVPALSNVVLPDAVAPALRGATCLPRAIGEGCCGDTGGVDVGAEDDSALMWLSPRGEEAGSHRGRLGVQEAGGRHPPAAAAVVGSAAALAGSPSSPSRDEHSAAAHRALCSSLEGAAAHRVRRSVSPEVAAVLHTPAALRLMGPAAVSMLRRLTGTSPPESAEDARRTTGDARNATATVLDQGDGAAASALSELLAGAHHAMDELQSPRAWRPSRKWQSPETEAAAAAAAATARSGGSLASPRHHTHCCEPPSSARSGGHFAPPLTATAVTTALSPRTMSPRPQWVNPSPSGINEPSPPRSSGSAGARTSTSSHPALPGREMRRSANGDLYTDHSSSRKPEVGRRAGLSSLPSPVSLLLQLGHQRTVPKLKLASLQMPLPLEELPLIVSPKGAPAGDKPSPSSSAVSSDCFSGLDGGSSAQPPPREGEAGEALPAWMAHTSSLFNLLPTIEDDDDGCSSDSEVTAASSTGCYSPRLEQAGSPPLLLRENEVYSVTFSSAPLGIAFFECGLAAHVMRLLPSLADAEPLSHDADGGHCVRPDACLPVVEAVLAGFTADAAAADETGAVAYPISVSAAAARAHHVQVLLGTVAAPDTYVPDGQGAAVSTADGASSRLLGHCMNLAADTCAAADIEAARNRGRGWVSAGAVGVGDRLLAVNGVRLDVQLGEAVWPDEAGPGALAAAAAAAAVFSPTATPPPRCGAAGLMPASAAAAAEEEARLHAARRRYKRTTDRAVQLIRAALEGMAAAAAPETEEEASAPGACVVLSFVSAGTRARGVLVEAMQQVMDGNSRDAVQILAAAAARASSSSSSSATAVLAAHQHQHAESSFALIGEGLNRAAACEAPQPQHVPTGGMRDSVAGEGGYPTPVAEQVPQLHADAVHTGAAAFATPERSAILLPNLDGYPENAGPVAAQVSTAVAASVAEVGCSSRFCSGW